MAQTMERPQSKSEAASHTETQATNVNVASTKFANLLVGEQMRLDLKWAKENRVEPGQQTVSVRDLQKLHADLQKKDNGGILSLGFDLALDGYKKEVPLTDEAKALYDELRAFADTKTQSEGWLSKTVGSIRERVSGSKDGGHKNGISLAELQIKAKEIIASIPDFVGMVVDTNVGSDEERRNVKNKRNSLIAALLSLASSPVGAGAVAVYEGFQANSAQAADVRVISVDDFAQLVDSGVFASDITAKDRYVVTNGMKKFKLVGDAHGDVTRASVDAIMRDRSVSDGGIFDQKANAAMPANSVVVPTITDAQPATKPTSSTPIPAFQPTVPTQVAAQPAPAPTARQAPSQAVRQQMEANIRTLQQNRAARLPQQPQTAPQQRQAPVAPTKPQSDTSTANIVKPFNAGEWRTTGTSTVNFDGQRSTLQPVQTNVSTPLVAPKPTNITQAPRTNEAKPEASRVSYGGQVDSIKQQYDLAQTRLRQAEGGGNPKNIDAARTQVAGLKNQLRNIVNRQLQINHNYSDNLSNASTRAANDLQTQRLLDLSHSLGAQSISQSELPKAILNGEKPLVRLNVSSQEAVPTIQITTPIIGETQDKSVIDEQKLGITADGYTLVRRSNDAGNVFIRAVKDGKTYLVDPSKISIADTSDQGFKPTEADKIALFSASGLTRQQAEQSLLVTNPNADSVRHTVKETEIPKLTSAQAATFSATSGFNNLIAQAQNIGNTENKAMLQYDELGGDSAAATRIVRTMNGKEMDRQTFIEWTAHLRHLNELFSQQKFDEMEKITPGSKNLILSLRQIGPKGSVLLYGNVNTDAVAKEAASLGNNQLRGTEKVRMTNAIRQADELSRILKSEPGLRGRYPVYIDGISSDLRAKSTTPADMVKVMDGVFNDLSSVSSASPALSSWMAGWSKTRAEILSGEQNLKDLQQANDTVARFSGSNIKGESTFKETHTIKLNPLPTILGAFTGSLAISITTNDSMKIGFSDGTFNPAEIQALRAKADKQKAEIYEKTGSKTFYDIVVTYQKLKNLPVIGGLIPTIPVVGAAYSQTQMHEYEATPVVFNLEDAKVAKQLQDSGRVFAVAENLAANPQFNAIFKSAIESGLSPEQALIQSANRLNYEVTDPATGQKRQMSGADAQQVLASFNDVKQVLVDVAKRNENLTGVKGSIPITVTVPDQMRIAAEIASQSVGTQINPDALVARGASQEYVNSLKVGARTMQSEANQFNNQHDYAVFKLTQAGATQSQAEAALRVVRHVKESGQLKNEPNAPAAKIVTLNGEIGNQYGRNGTVFTATYDNVKVVQFTVVGKNGESKIVTLMVPCVGNPTELEKVPNIPQVPDVKLCLAGCLIGKPVFSFDARNGAAEALMKGYSKAKDQEMLNQLDKYIGFVEKRLNKSAAPVVQEKLRGIFAKRMVGGKLQPFSDLELLRELDKLGPDDTLKVYDEITLAQLVVSMNLHPEIAKLYMEGDASTEVAEMQAEVKRTGNFDLTIGNLFKGFIPGTGLVSQTSKEVTAAGQWSNWQSVPGTNLEQRTRDGATTKTTEKKNPLSIGVGISTSEQVGVTMVVRNRVLGHLYNLCQLIGIENPSIADLEKVGKSVFGANFEIPRESKNIQTSKDVETREKTKTPLEQTNENNLGTGTPSALPPLTIEQLPTLKPGERLVQIPTPGNLPPGTTVYQIQGTTNVIIVQPTPANLPPVTFSGTLTPSGEVIKGAPIPSNIAPGNGGIPLGTTNINPNAPTPPGQGPTVVMPNKPVTPPATQVNTQESTITTPTPSGQGETDVLIKSGNLNSGTINQYNNGQSGNFTNINYGTGTNVGTGAGLTSEGSVDFTNPNSVIPKF